MSVDERGSMILFELNEVPWRVFDRYVTLNPSSNLARLGRESMSFTSLTHDTGELHPWTTWPSLHRGVYNTRHGITFINQAITTDYPPVWEILQRAGVSVGVFGSLQSYASFPSKPSDYAFFVPDTFAPSERTFPASVEAFQRLNLRMTERDGAKAKPGVPVDLQVVRDLFQMARTGMRMRTVAILAQHLVRERIDSRYCSRRSVLQAPVAFDQFVKLYCDTKPRFATFFTNHVAGMMHRYWQHTFPEDFPDRETHTDRVRSTNIDFAMDVADAQVGELLAICKERGADLWVATSMGQEAVSREPYFGELRITDGQSFVRGIGWNEPVEINLAMQPDFAFSLKDESMRARFRACVENVRDENDGAIFMLKESGNTLNLNLRPTPHCVREEKLYLRKNSELVAVPVRNIGIDTLFRDPGTGYHQPRGLIQIWSSNRKTIQRNRTEIDLDQVLPTILEFFGVDRPSYCAEPIHL